MFRALETGVSAFVAKTAPVEEVLAAIRHAAVAASSFTASGLAVALARRRSVQERLSLSPRETEVLRLLRDGLSIPAIALAMFISQSTAKTYVARLYDKLGAGNRAQALMTAVHYGLIHYEQDPLPELPLPRRTLRADRGRAAAGLSLPGRPYQPVSGCLAAAGPYKHERFRSGTAGPGAQQAPARLSCAGLRQPGQALLARVTACQPGQGQPGQGQPGQGQPGQAVAVRPRGWRPHSLVC
jgi:DNA-binding CsgD family transcriptional regulator